MEVDHVFDIQIGKDLSLLESGNEFVKRFKLQDALPMLASSCPGWICYAEKTHSQIIHLIDSTKSPQQIMGSLIKLYIGSNLGFNPDQIYHVTGN
jgi:iron only hydrogenase large subunit-like protein